MPVALLEQETSPAHPTFETAAEIPQRRSRVIARVYKFASGAVMSFDPYGKLISPFCGQVDKLHDDILSAAPPDAQFFTVDEETIKTKISREEF